MVYTAPLIDLSHTGLRRRSTVLSHAGSGLSRHSESLSTSSGGVNFDIFAPDTRDPKRVVREPRGFIHRICGYALLHSYRSGRIPIRIPISVVRLDDVRNRIRPYFVSFVVSSVATMDDYVRTCMCGAPGRESAARDRPIDMCSRPSALVCPRAEDGKCVCVFRQVFLRHVDTVADIVDPRPVLVSSA